MQDFVPSDHDFVIFGDDLLQALVEVRLQVPIVLHAVGMDEFLNFRIGVPLLAVDFVASDVKVDVGKQLGHFGDELFQELVGRLTRGIHDRINVTRASALESIRAGTAGKFGISHEPRPAVAGDVELGHHANATIMGIGDELANLFLRVKHAVGSHAGQLGKFLTFHAKTLIVGKMPVQNVHLYGGHAVEVAFEHIDWNEMSAHVDEHAAPGKARLIFDGGGGDGESGGSDLDELKKSLQASHDAE